MPAAGDQPRFALVTTLVAVVLFGLTFSVSGSRSAGGTPSRGGASILLTKTVGTDPGACATTDSITVASGTTVTYCYEVENTGDQSFDSHTLDDDQLGTLLSNFPMTLDPGNSFAVTETAQILATTLNTAVWTAFGDPDDAFAVDSATVTVAAPTIELFKTAGTDPETCAKDSNLVIDLPTDVSYCYEAHNTGNVSFSLHDLVDDQLGLLLDDHVEFLAPGEFLQVIATTPIAATTVNSATWTANDPFFAEASDMATVTLALLFMDGLESGDTTAWSSQFP